MKSALTTALAVQGPLRIELGARVGGQDQRCRLASSELNREGTGRIQIRSIIEPAGRFVSVAKVPVPVSTWFETSALQQDLEWSCALKRADLDSILDERDTWLPTCSTAECVE